MQYCRTPKSTLADRAYEQIKDALCQGKIVPGDILSESQLAQSLGMSRTPVREALRALASEDWLEIRNGVGAYVKPLSSKEMEDLYEVRGLLEVQAARTAALHISSAEIDRLEERFGQVLESYERGEQPDLEAFSALDWELHALVVDRCENNYIKTIMANNTANMRRYQFLSVEALNDVRESCLQHLNILALLRARDIPALTQALRDHLSWAASLLKRF